jgi:hypothetical protein
MSGYVTADDATFVFGAYATHVDRPTPPETEAAAHPVAELELSQEQTSDPAPSLPPSASPGSGQS